MTTPSDDSQPTEYDYHNIAKPGELKQGQGKSFTVAGHVIGLFYSEGKYYALNDFCPHQGASLSGGHVEQGQVMCPWHAWRFNLNDGSWADAPTSPVRCNTYPVRIEGDEIQVGIPRKTEM